VRPDRLLEPVEPAQRAQEVLLRQHVKRAVRRRLDRGRARLRRHERRLAEERAGPEGGDGLVAAVAAKGEENLHRAGHHEVHLLADLTFLDDRLA
jgi:hypothetical protein